MSSAKGRKAPDAQLRQRRFEALAGIRKALDNQGRMQIWLADKAQVKRTCLWNYLNGLSRMPRDVWDRMCRALELDPDTMLQLVQDPELILQPAKGEKGRRAA